NAADLAQELFLARVSGHERGCPLAERVGPQARLVAEHEDSDLAKSGRELADHVKATNTRQRKIDHENVGPKLLGQPDARVSMLGLADDRHIRLVSQARADPLPCRSIIVGLHYEILGTSTVMICAG